MPTLPTAPSGFTAGDDVRVVDPPVANGEELRGAPVEAGNDAEGTTEPRGAVDAGSDVGTVMAFGDEEGLEPAAGGVPTGVGPECGSAALPPTEAPQAAIIPAPAMATSIRHDDLILRK